MDINYALIVDCSGYIADNCVRIGSKLTLPVRLIVMIE